MIWGRMRLAVTRFDRALSGALDRVLPDNVTTRYILALGIIAGLAAAGQIIIQVSLDRLIANNRLARIMDRQMLFVEDARKAALGLQLSSGFKDSQVRLETMKGALDRLIQNHRELPIARELPHLLNVPPEALKELDHEMARIVSASSGLGKSVSDRMRGHALADASALGELMKVLIDSSTKYQAVIKEFVVTLERRHDGQVRHFRNIEIILFGATILVLLFEALYVFRPAVRRLYRALRTRSDFLSRMSHELRNPLNSVMGMTELLGRTNLGDVQRNYLAVQKRSSSALLEMLTSLLDVSSIDSGKLKLERVPFNLLEVLERSLDLVVSRAEANHTELIVDVAPETPIRISGDPLRLQQVLANLLGNAVKFTQSGVVTLRVGTEGRVLRFTVEDTGIGIDKDKIATIFDPFVQEDSSVRRKYGGSGLGLAICKEIVTRMGGRLAVVSEKNKGSAFSFSLPLDASATSDLRAMFKSAGLSKAKAIVLEPCDAVFHSLARALEAAEMEVARAVDSSEVWDFLARNAPRSVALVDLASAGGLFHGDAKTREGSRRILYLARTTADAQQIETVAKMGRGGIAFKPLRPGPLMEALIGALHGSNAVMAKTHGYTPQDAPPAWEGGNMRILVVDDSKDNQFLIRSYLQGTSCKVEYADDGRQALELFRANPFDLVLMDIEMPEMDGYEAVGLMRAFEAATKAAPKPIVALSAYSNQMKAQAAGFTRLLVKPVTANGLLQVISAVTGRKEQSQGVDGSMEKLERRVKNMAPTYLQNRRKDMVDMRQWLATGEFKMIERIGHRMKGNALSYGFADLGLLGGELENAARAGDKNRVIGLLSRIEDYLTRAATAMPRQEGPPASPGA